MMKDRPIFLFQTADQRWKAIVERDGLADGVFVYAVRSTGVYCRPSCPSRRARRENVSFFGSAASAEAAGYRPCKRCRPDTDRGDVATIAIRHACRLIEEADEEPDLATLAKAAGYSPWYFQRLFKARLGLTPKQYAKAKRRMRLRTSLAEAASVTDAIYAAGYGASSRAYDDQHALGMSPAAFRNGAYGERIRFTFAESSLGNVLVAVSERGVCMIEFGDPTLLSTELAHRFPKAQIEAAHEDLAGTIADVVRLIDDPRAGSDLPLDIRGTAFQERVWRALALVPAGETLSYAELAERIGQPGAARTVARACAANGVAVAVPCHRVVRGNGDLAGYKWGVERKRALLEREGVNVSKEAVTRSSNRKG